MGSMGSVAKVRKRAQAIGGSARKSVQERVKWEARIDACFRLPLVGGLFSFCLRPKADLWLDEVSTRHAVAGNDKMRNATSATKTTPSSEMIFAMKSIHLSRITDDTFVQELRNEISILKTLDHPHIVKAIETFDHRNQLFVIMELCSGGDLCTSWGWNVCLWIAMLRSAMQLCRRPHAVLLRRTMSWLYAYLSVFFAPQTRAIHTPKRKQHVS